MSTSGLDRWATFDCYGTLVDWERGIADALSDLWPGQDPDQLLASFHRIEPVVQTGSAMPYREVLGRTVRGVADEAGLPLADGGAGRLAESLPGWPVFPEVPGSLHELRDRGWRLGVLSNTDPDLLAASVAAIGVDPDLQITAAEARSYKPAPGHWVRFRERSGADPTRHVHVAASLFHDIEPAAALGIPAVWINRLGQQSALPRAGELPDLAGLTGLLEGLVPPG